MTSTLSLWRNLGTVLGVAISSLIVQNSLLVYLEQYVTGPDKAQIIDKVRKSVRAIGDLHGTHQHEGMSLSVPLFALFLTSEYIAVLAYAAALRITFISAIVVFVIVNLLILPVKLPRLGREKLPAEED